MSDSNPDYTTWPLEKLQHEYYKLRVDNASLRLKQATVEADYQEMEDFIRSFRKFLRRIEDE